MVRRMPDGSWRRIVEQRLADGRLLNHGVDMSELVTARAAIASSQRRLEDTIEALPAGFEPYDVEDRMIAANAMLKSMYPRVADLFGQRRALEEIVRANVQRGGLPEVEATPWSAGSLASTSSTLPPR